MGESRLAAASGLRARPGPAGCARAVVPSSNAAIPHPVLRATLSHPGEGLDGDAVQVVFVGAFDLHGDDVAGPERPARGDMDAAVDLRRIPFRAALRQACPGLVDDDGNALADALLEPARADLLLRLHEAMPALLLDLVRYRCGDVVGRGAADRLIPEAADTLELGLLEPGEQELEILVRLARKADDEGRADGKIRTDLAPAPDALRRLFLMRRPAHVLEYRRRGVLERNVEIGKHLAVGHELDGFVHMRVGVDVVQADPGAELAERLREIEKARPHLAPAPFAGRVFQIDPVGARVLRDDQDFLDAGFHQPLGFAQHVARRPADEVPAQLRDDAERA